MRLLNSSAIFLVQVVFSQRRSNFIWVKLEFYTGETLDSFEDMSFYA